VAAAAPCMHACCTITHPGLWRGSGPCTGKIHWKNTADQLKLVGPSSLGVALLTAGFVGMVFTIQVRGMAWHGMHARARLGVALVPDARLHAPVMDPPQFVREFAKLGLTRSVGGVLALALSRELTPVITAIILAGRVGSAFAAELGTMQVRTHACMQDGAECRTMHLTHTQCKLLLDTHAHIACAHTGLGADGFSAGAGH
jgi:hypothetical protein